MSSLHETGHEHRSKKPREKKNNKITSTYLWHPESGKWLCNLASSSQNSL